MYTFLATITTVECVNTCFCCLLLMVKRKAFKQIKRGEKKKKRKLFYHWVK